MGGIVQTRNIGSLITTRRGTAAATATAGGTGDATTSTGDSIDRASIGMPQSAQFSTLYETTLASGKTLAIATTIQHSTDNSSFTDYATEASTVVATGPSGGGVVKGVREVNVNLSSAYQYVRMNNAPDLSATVTDTAVCRGVAVFGGAAQFPATA